MLATMLGPFKTRALRGIFLVCLFHCKKKKKMSIEKEIEKALEKALDHEVKKVDAEAENIANQLKQLNETLSDFKSMLTKDSSYATGVLLMMGGIVIYTNSMESVWKTSGMLLIAGGVAVVLK
jgi:DUF438 domain-containing protein